MKPQYSFFLGVRPRSDCHAKDWPARIEIPAGVTFNENGIEPERQTSRLCFTAASMKLANKGCGSNGFDFSSGWNWTPMNHG